VHAAEDGAVCAAAVLTGRPVNWIEDRREHFLSSTQERDQYWKAAIAVDGNGNARSQAYDRLGRMVQTVDASNVARSTTYDAFDRVLSQTDALGNVTRTVYSTSGRSVSVTTPEGEEQLLRWMLPGEISGLSSVFAETTYPADLVTVGTTQVLHIERTRLIDLINRDPAVAVDLLRIVGLRINQLLDTLADQSMHSLEQRVWAALERIAKFNSVAVPDGVMLRVSQSDLAQAASASRQRVNQQLRHFQDQGLIRLGYRNIVLLRR
jgi:YD repeat-containing protein